MLLVSGFELIFCYSFVSVLFFPSVFVPQVPFIPLPFAGTGPFSGQDFLSLQLQVFPCFSFIFVDSRTVLLWLEITEYHLSWDIIERAQPYSAATNRCNLCIAEKYFILKTKPSLNKRREIFSSCSQRKKH